MNIYHEGYVNLGIALLLMGISLPLVIRKVSMNQTYGFRTAEAFRSEKQWYKINAAGGKRLFFSSLPLLIVGFVQSFAPENAGLIYHWLSVVVVVPFFSCLLSCVAGRKKKASENPSA